MSDTRPGDLYVYHTWIRVAVALPARTWGAAISVPLAGGEADLHPCMFAGIDSHRNTLIMRFE